MRGAGCIINDLWDRDIDAQVERTRSRPLASGQISVTAAVLFLGCLSGCGLLGPDPAATVQLGCWVLALCLLSFYIH